MVAANKRLRRLPTSSQAGQFNVRSSAGMIMAALWASARWLMPELNRTMVRDGWAFVFVKYSDRYPADQAAAEIAKAGL